MNTNEIRCPDCGSALDVQKDVLVSEPMLTGYLRADATELPRRVRQTFAVAFCTGCEWAHEVRS